MCMSEIQTTSEFRNYQLAQEATSRVSLTQDLACFLVPMMMCSTVWDTSMSRMRETTGFRCSHWPGLLCWHGERQDLETASSMVRSELRSTILGTSMWQTTLTIGLRNSTVQEISLQNGDPPARATASSAVQQGSRWTVRTMCISATRPTIVSRHSPVLVPS